MSRSSQPRLLAVATALITACAEDGPAAPAVTERAVSTGVWRPLERCGRSGLPVDATTAALPFGCRARDLMVQQ